VHDGVPSFRERLRLAQAPVCRSSSVSACVISASEANTQTGQKDSKDKLVDELRTQVAV
jgi:hypothetical protein